MRMNKKALWKNYFDFFMAPLFTSVIRVISQPLITNVGVFMWWSSFQTAQACFFVKSVVSPPSLQKIHPFYPSIFCKWASKPPLCKKIFRFSLLFFANELQSPLFAKILRLVPHCANLVPFPPASPNLLPAKKGLWKTEMFFHSLLLQKPYRHLIQQQDLGKHFCFMTVLVSAVYIDMINVRTAVGQDRIQKSGIGHHGFLLFV